MWISLRPQAGTGNWQEVVLSAGEAITIGRSDADLTIPHDLLLSRRHVRITCYRTYAVVHDLHSTNGTFLNGRRVYHSRLQTGDVMCAGLQLICVTLNEDATLCGTS